MIMRKPWIRWNFRPPQGLKVLVYPEMIEAEFYSRHRTFDGHWRKSGFYIVDGLHCGEPIQGVTHYKFILDDEK